LKKAIHHFYRGLALTGIFLATTSMHSADSGALLQPPGQRLVSDPATVISATHQCDSIAFRLTGDLIFTPFR
jgi:hypothetical protein